MTNSYNPQMTLSSAEPKTKPATMNPYELWITLPADKAKTKRIEAKKDKVVPEKMKRNTLDKIAIATSVTFGIDAIVMPALTGSSLHELIGLSPSGDYKTIGEAAIRGIEILGWGVSLLYQSARIMYDTYKPSSFRKNSRAL